MRRPLDKLVILAGGVAGAAVFAAGYLLAQPLPPGTILTGNELINITTQGGSIAQLPLPQVRNASNLATTTTATGTITMNSLVGTEIFTAALSGGVTVNTPAAPYDGEYLTLANGTGSAFTQTITLTANPAASPAQTVNAGAAATMPANSSVEWQYSVATTTWYRLR